MVAIIINEFLKLTVKSSGAEMISIKNTITNKEYLWQGNPAYWARRAPVLFPIVGKLNNNNYRVNSESYELPQHGFARDMHFELIDHVENSLTYLLKSNSETLKVYPYKFELYIKYSLEQNKVVINYEIKNCDDDLIYFSLGAHPAFNCPLESNEKFSDYYLTFEKEESIDTLLLENGLLNGKSSPMLLNQTNLPLTTALFDQDALIFHGLKSRNVALKSYKSKHSIAIDFTGFPYLGIWSKKGGSPFVCIEPWMGIADSLGFEGSFKEKTAVRSLAKGKTFHAEYSITID
ncbi:MAG: aldose 1-epimerase family protein [Cytophagales bacterium]|nr:MAG: aldose 1-epimerase family protein [Cytophagales bacterium]